MKLRGNFRNPVHLEFLSQNSVFRREINQQEPLGAAHGPYIWEAKHSFSSYFHGVLKRTQGELGVFLFSHTLGWALLFSLTFFFFYTDDDESGNLCCLFVVVCTYIGGSVKVGIRFNVYC